ncbi:glycosyl hydrolase [Klebsiella variicola]|uniref:glycosyl hydrolase n=1 Tax=Klebsiella pneumoniae complex TaxID=3390273 RepID=UPI000F29C127|nr:MULTISPECIES: glycosyl hydrolase [Klebsiella]HBS2506008.1 hypothetical protein [Klebsiella variicola subsp. variicola]MDW0343060.1 glycosyl hydrolase [Klebsiella variicola]WHE64353.1 glycosyl hydrolase [Klebsiella variicola]VCW26214.1 hypothetical protein BANRA_03854 [Klebsiella variicola]VDA29695.1 hypothetical protein BANRA_01665 [Klebsiella quasipneumoniae]
MNMNKLYLVCILFLSRHANAYDVGIGVHPLEFKGSPEEFVSLLEKYHFSSFRVDYPWKYVEQEKRQYESASPFLDEVIFLAAKKNIRPLIILDYGNKLYGDGKPVTPDQVKAFSLYARWTANHFKSTHPIYEIWNEWSLQKPRYVSHGEKSASEYVTLVKETSKEIKSQDSQSSIIAGGFTPSIPGEIEWGEMIVKFGILKYADGLSIHPYNHWVSPFPSVDESLKNIQMLQSKLSSVNNGNKVDIYITEYGLSDFRGSKLTDEQISSYASEYLKQAKQNGNINGIWWYDLINDGTDGRNIEDNFGLLTNDLKEKPLAKAFKVTAQKDDSNK